MTANFSNNGQDEKLVTDSEKMGQKRPRVHFSRVVAVKKIESARSSYSVDEKQATWYTRKEMGDLRRKSLQLIKHYNEHYDDEELFDLFGVQSRDRLCAKRERVERVTSCVILLRDLGYTWKPENEEDFVVEVYNAESESSVESALDFAQMVRRQAYRRSSLVRSE